MLSEEYCLQVKQLRNRADEDARLIHMALQMGSEPPSSLRKDLDHLMILVSIPLHLSSTSDLMNSLALHNSLQPGNYLHLHILLLRSQFYLIMISCTHFY